MELLYACRFPALWTAPIVLVGHSFGGLLLKNLVVQVEKQITRSSDHNHEVRSDTCRKFMLNLKATVFYSVPSEDHAGTFWDWQCQMIKYPTKTFWWYFERWMRTLSVEFNYLPGNYISFAFDEGEPIETLVS